MPSDAFPFAAGARGRVTEAVETLEHATPAVAAAIHGVMMAAYRVEAEFLGLAPAAFAPLRRPVSDVAGAGATFLGIRAGNGLAAVAEIEREGDAHVHIASLVVRPDQFRRGLGRRLVREVIGRHRGGRITVSTGARNTPAIRLYTSNGFVEWKRWSTPDGIAMVTFEWRGEA